MTVSRRELVVGAGIFSALTATASVSACSPADIYDLTDQAEFFAKVSKGQLLDAQEFLSSDVTMSIVSTQGAHLFDGRRDVAEAVYKLLVVEGFSMIGDNSAVSAGGMYWRPIGPWICSDMIKGNAVNLSGCGDGLLSSVFNVYVNLNEGKIGTILLLENRNLMLDWDFGLEASRVIEK